jgi:hypothetical protein
MQVNSVSTSCCRVNSTSGIRDQPSFRNGPSPSAPLRPAWSRNARSPFPIFAPPQMHDLLHLRQAAIVAVLPYLQKQTTGAMHALSQALPQIGPARDRPSSSLAAVRTSAVPASSTSAPSSGRRPDAKRSPPRFSRNDAASVSA